MKHVVLACNLGATLMLSAPCMANADAEAETRDIVESMLADAASHLSLDSDAAAGHDGVFFLASPDAGARLEITGFTQFRWTGAYGANATGDDFDSGFSFRRTRLSFQGSLFNEKLSFKITDSINSRGAHRLSDAFIETQLTDRVQLQLGQFKLPFAREELNSAKRLLANDRSIVNDVFGQGRSQGVAISWQGERVRAHGAFSDGLNSDNSDFTGDPADWAVTGRVEWLPLGSWRQFNDFTSPRGSKTAVLIGAAVNMETSSDMPGAPAFDRFSWTIDAGVEGDGWHGFVAVSGRESEEAAGRFHDLGVVAQGSVYATDSVEPFLRFDVVLPDGDRAGDDPFRTVALGVNWYLHGHSAKFTVDWQWFLDDASDNDLVAASASQGLLPGAGDGSGALRAQFQIVF